jgi:cation transport regulator ChaB
LLPLPDEPPEEVDDGAFDASFAEEFLAAVSFDDDDDDSDDDSEEVFADSVAEEPERLSVR